MKELRPLKEIYREAGELKNLIDGATVVLHWDKAVDQTIAQKTEALKFKNGVLFVEAVNSVWANELTYLRKEIIQKLNQICERQIVKEIRFLVKGEKNGKREFQPV